jgi:hypothetical protein
VKKREHICIVDIVAAKSDPIAVRLMELMSAKKGFPTPESRWGGDAMWTTRENGDVVFIGPGLLRRGGATLIQKAEECALEYVEKIAAEARAGPTSPLSRKPGKGSQDSLYAKFWGRTKIERENGVRPFTGEYRAVAGKFDMYGDDLFADMDSEVDVEREELEKENLGNYDGIILKNPLSSSLFEYGADLFPKSILNAVRGESRYTKVGEDKLSSVIAIGDSIRFDKEGTLKSLIVAIGGSQVAVRPVRDYSEEWYPFSKLLPLQLVEVSQLSLADHTCKIKPVPMIPLLVRDESRRGGACFCGRPCWHSSSVDRYVMFPCDAEQAAMLWAGPGGERSSPKKAHKVDCSTIFCDYTCLVRFFADIFKSNPVTGNRLVCITRSILVALEDLTRDLIPALLNRGTYVLSTVQVQLLSGYWPLCGVAARTLFVQLVNVAEKQRLHGFLEFEMGMRAELLSMDLQVGPAVTSSKDNAPQTPPKKDVEDVEDCQVDCTDEFIDFGGQDFYDDAVYFEDEGDDGNEVVDGLWECDEC